MSWRVAYSLDQLLKQWNALFPKRSKLSDGSIGDAAHSSRTSDHNPDGAEIVRARDYTHDPANGADCQKLADALVTSGDPRIKYIIWNRRIWERSTGWKPYSGVNPHTKHLHLSVVTSGLADATTPWNLPGLSTTPAPPAPKPPVEDDMTDADRAMLTEVRDLLRDVRAQLVGPDAKLGEFTGWPTFEGGTNERLTLVDYNRRTNTMLQALKAAVAGLAARQV